jgi:3-phosphoshikimate 1-carboxyvinyltransferase
MFSGELRVPSDKSISHRALIFSLLTKGQCHIERLSPAKDCQSTIACLRQLGVEFSLAGSPEGYDCTVESPWLSGLNQSKFVLDAGNSGTTIRLLSGLLAGRPFRSTLDGDSSLRKRPMSRVLNLIDIMGAGIEYEKQKGYAPFTIKGGKLEGREFELPVASAQVQTALLLAGLQAEGTTSVILKELVRDHTRRMFDFIGVPYESNSDMHLAVRKLSEPLSPFRLSVPSDISSAAFFMVGAALMPGSHLTLTDVCLNPGRTLVIDVLKEMGADIEIEVSQKGGEPTGDICIKYAGRLRGATISGARLATGIDEIPVLALAGALCDGEFKVENASELRVKESDRISAIVENLKAAGAEASEAGDGFKVTGRNSLKGGTPWLCHDDHRIAMMGAMASLVCQTAVHIDNPGCASVSYPSFAADLKKLTGKAAV